MTSSKIVEVNVDRVVGPTHHFGGLGVGNLASLAHAGKAANPRAAAIQGIEKMRLCAALGGRQLVLPPHRRPKMRLLEELGFYGSPGEILAATAAAPEVLSAAWSDSAMWTANAATVTPACESADSLGRLTVANLTSSLHRSIEPPESWRQLSRMFHPAGFRVHRPLPPAAMMRDEGAANHMRLCDADGRNAVHVFVFGEDARDNDHNLRGEANTASLRRFPARQTLQAAQAIARRHRLDPRSTFFIRQHPAAIEAGAFHNDVVATSCNDVLVYHQDAFEEDPAGGIAERFEAVTGQPLRVHRVERSELSLEEAVATYLFNSQLIPAPGGDGTMTMVCPIQAAEHGRASAAIDRLVRSVKVIREVRPVDLTESMSNGGGPACLRLRVPLTPEQWGAVPAWAKFSESLAERLIEAVERTYPTRLQPEDLTRWEAAQEAFAARAEIERLLAPPAAI